ncbi:MAG: ribonuclease HII [Clostridia bacterium]|nr:ribonuclease HII [Clostridia bacterium]
MKKKQDEQQRLVQMTEFERKYWQMGIFPCGMDEVGRGPLAGPVVAACVIMPPEPLIEYVNDSKKLTELRREKLYDIIKETAIAYGVGWVDAEKIDELGIVPATKMAFEKAFSEMISKYPCEYALVDAVKGLNISAKQESIIHGDALSYSIAAASIIAKVERDRFMIELDKEYPAYGFARNKGYGTKEHIAALKTVGKCSEHRESFIHGIIRKDI